MKFEFVEFYPFTPGQRRDKKALGTAHIYAIDCELDIRGIYVTKCGNTLFFHLPHMTQIDPETNETNRYPHIRFTNEKTHKEMMDFLHQTVKPIIFKALNPKLKVVICTPFKFSNASKNDAL